MTTYEFSDLHKRVARYEAALEEMRSAQQDIKNVLHDQILYERWQMLGADLGFAVVPNGAHPSAAHPEATGQPTPQMAEAWG